MSDISVGDVVTLKSGGPAMTVSEIGRNERTGRTNVACKWFDKNEQVKEDVFAIELLAKAY